MARGLSSAMSGARSQIKTLPCKSRVASILPSAETAQPCDGGFVAPELRKVAMSLPPEIAPGEAARVETVWLGLDVVEDVLGQLSLAGVERPAGEPQALGIVVPIGQPPPFLGDAASVGRLHVFAGRRGQSGFRAAGCATPANWPTRRCRRPTRTPGGRPAPSRAATAGRRRAQLRARSQAETGRPRIGRPSRNRSRSSRSARPRHSAAPAPCAGISGRSSPGRAADPGAANVATPARLRAPAARSPDRSRRETAGGRSGFRRGSRRGRRRRSPDRSRAAGPRPARVPCNGAYPAGPHSASRRRPPRRAWPGRSRSSAG